MRGQLENGSWRDPEDPGEVTTGQPRISITPAEGRILRRLFRDCRVLEIGTGLGISTGYILESALWVHTVDTDPWVWANTWVELNHAHPNLTCYRSRDSLPRTLAGIDFDGAFIDGSHRFADVLEDLSIALALVQRGGLIVMHDAGYGEVRNAVAEKHLDWRVISTTYQLGVISCP